MPKKDNRINARSKLKRVIEDTERKKVKDKVHSEVLHTFIKAKEVEKIHMNLVKGMKNNIIKWSAYKNIDKKKRTEYQNLALKHLETVKKGRNELLEDMETQKNELKKLEKKIFE